MTDGSIYELFENPALQKKPVQQPKAGFSDLFHWTDHKREKKRKGENEENEKSKNNKNKIKITKKIKKDKK